MFRTPLITIGEAGYNGTVDVGNLQVPEGRLDIIANGTGGTVPFDGDFTSTASGVPGGIGLFVEGSGATTTINGTITSATAVVIDDAVVVADGSHAINTSATNANITITGGTDGIYGAAGQTNSLTITAGSGTVILGNQTGFGDNAGNGSLLEDVTISAGATVLGSTPSEINGTFSVLSGTLSLGANLSAGAVDVASTAGTTLTGNVAVATTSGWLAFAGPVYGAADLAINAATTTTFGAAVGGTTPLAALVIAKNGSTTTLGGNVTTTGEQTFSDPVALTSNVALTAGSVTLLSVDGGGFALATNTTTSATLGSGGVIGNLAGLVTEGGQTVLNGTIETTGGQVYVGNGTILDGPSTLQGAFSNFGSGVDARGLDLTLNFTQSTAVNSGVFSNIGSLTSLGPVALSGTIDSAGFQNYAAAATLSADTTLNATGNIDFGSTVDGARQLTIQSGGTAAFFGALGGSTPLQGLNLASASAVTALGTLAIDGTGGSGPGLRVAAGLNNVNIAQPGSTITNANLAGIRFAGNSFNSRVGGFTITGSGGAGVELSPGIYNNTFIENNILTAGGADGVYANGTIGSLTIAGNRIGGNARSGVRMENAVNFKGSVPVVANNTIGLDAAGNAAQPNAGQGIIFLGGRDGSAINNTIGGNGFYGVVVTGAAVGTTITGNRIGLGTDGTTAIGNGQSGVFVLAGSSGTTIVGNTIRNNNGMAGIKVVDGTSSTTIGGSGSSANLLVNNGLFGITVSGDVSGSRVLGNLVSSHTTANIYLNNAQNLAIGSAINGEENTFGTADYGVYAGGNLSGTTIEGNTFQQHSVGGMVLTGAEGLSVIDNTVDDNGAYGIYGTGNLTGTTVQGNTISNQTVGVLIDNGANLTIGSTNGTVANDALGNTITKNSSAGIVVNGANSSNITMLSNRIFENDVIGISLSDGANSRAVSPTLASASTTAVTGSISGTNSDVYRIQYFKSADAVTSSSQFAQGQELIGYQDVTIVGGTAALAFNLSSSSVIVTDWITATATLLVGGLLSETSQFSFGIRVTA